MSHTNNHIFLRQNTPFGLLIGASFIVTLYLYYKTGQNITLNPQMNNVLMLLSIAGCFLGARKYREEGRNGIINYAHALGTCVYLVTIAAVSYGIFVFFLYQSTPELVESYLSNIETAFKEIYANTPMTENLNMMMKAFTTPASIAFAEIFNKIFTGFIFSLFLAGIIRRNEPVKR